MTPYYQDHLTTIYCGDSLEIGPQLEANSIDGIITDTPYNLTNRVADTQCCLDCGRVMGGNDGNNSVVTCPRCQSENIGRQRNNSNKGFMGKEWDGSGIAFKPELWANFHTPLKPGAFVFAFGGTRTYHRLACAVEDAGYEIRDCIMYLYGSGFPKSLDIGKAIDKVAVLKVVMRKEEFLKQEKCQNIPSLKRI